MSKYFLFIILLFSFFSVKAVKTDIVVLKNGDRITGEIKELKKGKLKYSTDDISTIYIEWENISELYSPVTYEFITSSGDKFFGSIGWSKPGYFKIEGPATSIQMRLDSVVLIYPIKNGFWQRLDGSINIGLSYTKASGIGQGNADFKVLYRNRKSQNELKYSNIITYQDGLTQSTKQDAVYTYGRLIQKKRYWSTGLSWQQNSQLGILSRTAVNGQVGKIISVSNKNAFQASMGILLNSEVSYDDETNQNVEGLLKVSYEFFSFEDPKLTIYTHYYLYPSLTIPGRVRQDFNTEFKWKFISDFTVSFQIYVNTDSKPITIGASNLDWGLITSLGYTF
jgi:hypothetical protein